MRTAEIVATLIEPLAGGAPAALPLGVSVLELRADRLGDLDPATLPHGRGVRRLYTLRSAAEGGGHDGEVVDRGRRLAAAAGRFDLVDLEAERDLHPEVLEAVPAERRVLSWHGVEADRDALVARLERMRDTPAALYKLVSTPRQAGEELWPLQAMRQVGGDDVIAFAAGEGGAWTRLVAPRVGAPWVFGSLGDRPAVPGQPPIRRLIADYGLPDLPPAEALFGVVGHPVLHSLSPRLHNAGYRRLGLPYLYVPFDAERFGDFWLEVVEEGSLEELGLPLRGLSVTSPYKGAALAVAGAASPLAERLGSVNTLVLRDTVWEGENTDCEGIMLSIARHRHGVAGTRAAVVGGGRAGRAAAFSLALEGAEVVLVNRSAERGATVAAELDLPFLPLADFDPAGFDVVVHATSLGRDPRDPLPFAAEALRRETLLVDLVYGDLPTPLVVAARQRGLEVVTGREVLLAQGLGQFRLMTGRELPFDEGLEVLELDA